MMELQQLDHVPDALFDATASSLHTLLPKPTLIHLQGKHPEPLFVSILLHGNEPTGFLAVQALLKKYRHRELPRSLSIYFGNTLAASQGLRRLDSQPDFNRTWPGTELEPCEQSRISAEIVETMRRRNVFASIDVHNNTGLNPHYACVNRLDNRFLQLATLFGRLVVYFLRPAGVQSSAFANLCPAVTLECGRPGQKHGTDHALEYLDSCLHLTELSDDPVVHQDIDLFHTVASVKVSEGLDFGFDDPDAELILDREIERMNFTEIPPGTMFGKISKGEEIPLIARGEDGNIVTEDFFAIQNGELQIRRKTMPSMLTLDERVIRQDCLCYLMERIHL